MQTIISKIDQSSLEKAKELLLDNQVIGMPTETVYGLAGLGTSVSAVNKIFEIKGRPSDNPLIAHVHKDYDLNRLVYIEQDYVEKLLKAFTPGPLTMVFKSKGVIAENAVCGGDTLAIRIPSHQGAQALLSLIDMPLVAPSANLSKHTSPVTAKHVKDDLDGKISLILDGGKCTGGIESTVLDVTGKTPRILRAGLVTKEMIENIVGSCEIAEHKEGDKVKSPGVKYSHYKPKCQTKFFYQDQIEEIAQFYNQVLKEGKKPYIMCSSDVAENFKGKNLLNLGATGEEIASNLYDKLLEGEKIADVIIGVGFNREDGVFLGIMNRLKKSCL